MIVVARRCLRSCQWALALLLCIALSPRFSGAGGDTSSADGAGGATESNLKTRIQTYPVKAASGPIKIDGILDEAAWADAVEVSDFYEFRPGDGIPPRVRTVCKIAYDNDHVYFMARCFDPEPHKILAHLTDRDNCFQDDFVGVQLDTFLDHRTGYEFFVNPLGIQGDLAVSDGGNEDESFDCLWSSAAKIDSLGWTAEFSIPTKSIRFRNVPITEWGFWMYRNYPRESRFQLASHKMSRDEPCWNCQFDHLGSLSGLKAGKNLEVLPYVTQSAVRSREQFGAKLASESRARTGLSVKYGFTPSLTFDGTLNPDFAQVEADQGQISVNNTSALFFEEKRPFFLEGNGIFQVQGNLFYSRNIADPDWATKITGRQGKLQLGALVARDQLTPLIIPYSEGSYSIPTLEHPSTDVVLRVRSDLMKDSNIGFTGTGRSYGGKDGDAHNYLGALDGNIRVLPRVRWVWYAGLSRTRDLPGFTAEKYADADGENGFTAYQELNYSSRHYNSSIWYTQRSPSYRADLGFLEYNNVIALESWHEYDFNPTTGIVNFWRPALYLDYEKNYQGQQREHVIQPQMLVRFKHQWEVSGNHAFRFIRFNNPNIPRELVTNREATSFSLNKNGSSLLTGNFNLRYAGDVNRRQAVLANSRSYNATLNFRPSSNLLVKLTGNYYDLKDRGVDTMFVRQELASARLTYQFTPKLFVRLLTQGVTTSLPGSADQKSLSSQFLLSYKLNYATVFFFGINGDFENSLVNEDGTGSVTRPGLTTASNGLFAKFQYFWRL